MRVSVGRLVTFLPLALGHEFKSHIRIWPQTKLWFSNSSGRLEALSIPWCINFTTLLCTKLKVPERKGESKKTNSHYLKKKKKIILERIRKERERRAFSYVRYSLRLSLDPCEYGVFFLPHPIYGEKPCLHFQHTYNTRRNNGRGMSLLNMKIPLSKQQVGRKK